MTEGVGYNEAENIRIRGKAENTGFLNPYRYSIHRYVWASRVASAVKGNSTTNLIPAPLYVFIDSSPFVH